MAEMAAGPGVALERMNPAVASGAKNSLEKPTPDSAMARVEQHRQWTLLARLPLRLQVQITLPGFKVRDLLALGEGQMVLSAWPTSEDVPLTVGGVQVAWSEFEVVEQRMAIRLTRLA